jgi:hypothetical protein
MRVVCRVTLPSINIPSEIAVRTRQETFQTQRLSFAPANRLQRLTAGMDTVTAADTAVIGHNRQFLAHLTEGNIFARSRLSIAACNVQHQTVNVTVQHLRPSTVIRTSR